MFVHLSLYELSRFVYICDHVTLHVEFIAQKVYSLVSYRVSVTMDTSMLLLSTKEGALWHILVAIRGEVSCSAISSACASRIINRVSLYVSSVRHSCGASAGHNCLDISSL